MSPDNLIRRCCADLSRWSRTGRNSARPNQHRAAQIGLGPLLPGYRSLVATTALLPDHSARHLISSRSRNGLVEIPIEPAAALPPSRGFLP
jgi:hypothetical protein